MTIFRSVRARVMGLLLCAAIPISALAAFIAYDHYEMVTRVANKRVWATAHSVAANYATVISEARTSLTFLAGLVTPSDSTMLDPGVCSVSLSHAMGLSAQTFHNLMMVDPQGAVVCSAGVPGAHEGLDATRIAAWAAAGMPFVSDLLGARWQPIDGANLHVALPVGGDGQLLAVLRASLNVEPFARLPQPADPQTAPFVWLVDHDDATFALNGAPDSAVPPTAALDALRTAPDPRISVARSGTLFDYVRAPLTGDLDIAAGSPVQQELANARTTLVRQIMEVGALLCVGLALVAAGANYAVANPLNIMTLAVRRWRDGGPFAFGSATKMPIEIKELSESFGQAVAALNERERQLSEAKTQQELLMQEIHHRVKNNLQIIASLLNLQASRIRLPEAKAEFQSARDRIRALATLHRHLYAHGEIHTINMRSFLTELCEQLLQAIGEKPDADGGQRRIRLNIEARELQISSDQAVPMALIVTEAVSNAAKYAFPGGRSGSINVTLTEDDGLIKLVIWDDGVGIPAGRAETETGIRDGIGLQLIRGFARQLGATLTVIEDQGTRYELELMAHGPSATTVGDADGVVSHDRAGDQRDADAAN